MHEEEILDHLDLMIESVELVDGRFFRVRSAKDFVLSSSGITLLDAITMRLQVIGESVRKIQKLDPFFFKSLHIYRMGQTCKISGYGFAPLSAG